MEDCVFGWEHAYWLLGPKYCVTEAKNRYNLKEPYQLRWPYALMGSVLAVVLWGKIVLVSYSAFKAKDL